MRKVTLVILVFLYSSSSPLKAAITDEREHSILKEESKSASIEEAKLSKSTLSKISSIKSNKPTFQFGGSFSTIYRYYSNLDNSDGTPDFLKWAWDQYLYLWYFLNYGQIHNVYFQLNSSYADRGVGNTYTGIGADHEGPSISQLFYQLNLTANALLPLKATLGRQYLFLGRGIVYAALHDGLLLEHSFEKFFIKEFFSKTKPHEDNIDFSVPGYEKEGDRLQAGFEVAYLGIPNTSVYSYFFAQRDRSSENTDLTGQAFHYNSHYFGAGISSKPFGEQFETWFEIITEDGQGFTDASRTTLRKTNIDAWAGIGGAKYRFDLPTKPILETSFSYGSGDEDRTRVTNTIGGDLDGRDKNFLYFGYYQTGYALSPRLSNIEIWHLGASCQPLESISLFKKLAIGTKYFYYSKDKSQGLVSDFESTEDNFHVGDELDFFLQWKVTDNLTSVVRYGVFFPGKAYAETSQENTHYFYSSLTLTF